MRHPHIVRLYDSFEDHEEMKIVMELIRGEDAFEVMQKKVGAHQLYHRMR